MIIKCSRDTFFAIRVAVRDRMYNSILVTITVCTATYDMELIKISTFLKIDISTNSVSTNASGQSNTDGGARCETHGCEIFSITAQYLIVVEFDQRYLPFVIQQNPHIAYG